MKTLTVKITQAILNEATKKNSAKCMIAQAVRHAGGSSTHVTTENVSFNLDDTRYTFPLPARAAIQLIKFDNNEPVAPFQFKLKRGFTRPVTKRPHVKRGPTKKKKNGKLVVKRTRRSERRFHGLSMLIDRQAS